MKKITLSIKSLLGFPFSNGVQNEPYRIRSFNPNNLCAPNKLLLGCNFTKKDALKNAIQTEVAEGRKTQFGKFTVNPK
jgi:hypothetical protein